MALRTNPIATFQYFRKNFWLKSLQPRFIILHKWALLNDAGSKAVNATSRLVAKSCSVRAVFL